MANDRIRTDGQPVLAAVNLYFTVVIFCRFTSLANLLDWTQGRVSLKVK
jgi:hypothetical protein